jgi:tRNA(Ile)-lysidine synthase
MVATRRLTELVAPADALLSDLSGSMMVALSGGADSAAAAFVASARPDRTRAIHVDHGASGSARLRRAATSIAGALGLDLEVVSVDVPAGSSYEAQARAVRHRALRAAADDGEWIVTGHTLDDQVETVLMRLDRGSGLEGLSGMAIDSFPIVRPLLGSRRSDVREIATLAGLAWWDDPSHLDRRHLRNRVRRELIPRIEATFGGGLAGSVARAAQLVRADVDVLDALAAEIRCEVTEQGRRFVVADLVEAHDAIAARAIRAALRELLPPYPPPLHYVEALLEVARGGSRAATLGPMSARVQSGWLVIDVDHPAPGL